VILVFDIHVIITSKQAKLVDMKNGRLSYMEVSCFKLTEKKMKANE